MHLPFQREDSDSHQPCSPRRCGGKGGDVGCLLVCAVMGIDVLDNNMVNAYLFVAMDGLRDVIYRIVLSTVRPDFRFLCWVGFTKLVKVKVVILEYVGCRCCYI